MEAESLGVTMPVLLSIVFGAVAMIATVASIVQAFGIKPLKRSIDKLDTSILVMTSTNTASHREIGILVSEVENLKVRMDKLEAQIDELPHKKK